MKNKIKCVAIVLLLMGNLFDLPAQEAGKKEKKEKKTEEVVFLVSMYCQNCKKKIEKNISWEKGVKDLLIDLETKTVTIIYNPQKTTEEALKKAIEELGYAVEKVCRDKKRTE
ncbi:MAG: heavy-metal-associated domain-containing protein [Dysgonamonadaceae bacterium]|jgi:copper chaperone CopZ|nr:heavy-metal-associated domain-containing protein [Dysgonamonadaceae bacterium]